MNRKRKIVDKTSYEQYREYKSRGGAVVSAGKRRRDIFNTITSAVRFRYGRQQVFNAGSGAFWLTNHCNAISTVGDDTYTLRNLPVYCVPLFNVNQWSTVETSGSGWQGFGMYELMHKDWVGTAPIPNADTGFYWRAVNGIDPFDGSTPKKSLRAVLPSEARDYYIGRKGHLDWTRVKMQIYGAKQVPTKIRISMVRFLDEEFAPENYLNKATGESSIAPAKVQEFWGDRYKVLVNSASAGYGKVYPNRLKVLRQWDININPQDASAETAATDPRPHIKHLDIFNRWNRIIDFSEPYVYNTQGPTVPGVVYADLINTNKVPTATYGFTGYPGDKTKGVYLLIEAIQSNLADTINPGATSPANPRPGPGFWKDPPDDPTLQAASFDLVLESNWTVCERTTPGQAT